MTDSPNLFVTLILMIGIIVFVSVIIVSILRLLIFTSTQVGKDAWISAKRDTNQTVTKGKLIFDEKRGFIIHQYTPLEKYLLNIKNFFKYYSYWG